MGESVHSGVGRIVAVGDLHGNYAGLRRILWRTGLIDRRGRWCARDTHLVQLGDILGRGGEPGKIFRLLARLEAEAPAFGSRVHILLGNHEAMTLSGLFMYNTLEEFRDLAEGGDGGDGLLGGERPDLPELPETSPRRDRLEALGAREFRDLLSPAGRVGRWLASHDTAVRINDCLFVHGGLNREYGLMPLARLNDTVRRELASPPAPAPSGGDWSPAPDGIVLRRDGPQWNRELTLRPDAAKGRMLEEILAYHGCRRMVVGHTPTSCIDPSRAGEIVSLYNGRLCCVDTGIGKAYGENLSFLQVRGSEISADYP